MKNNQNEDQNSKILVNEFLRYLNFWPFYLLSIFIFLGSAYLYLRYTTYNFESSAKIEIIDKAQDSEMVLPSAMTVFNRSMINLENEVGVLSSFSLHKRVVSKLSSNVKFYTHGKVKKTENHKKEWFSDYDLNFKIDTDTIKGIGSFFIEISDNKMLINHVDIFDNEVKTYYFTSLTTLKNDTDLPFDLTINDDFADFEKKEIRFVDYNETVDFFIKISEILETGKDSDQLEIKLKYPNKYIANEYLNTLLSEFDNDGIKDRQLEYQRTMDFVDSRSDFLVSELNKIELERQKFKERNNLTDIKSDANINVTQKFNYDSELFKAKSQKDLILLLKESIINDKFKLMPVEIGIENSNLNELIVQYNMVLKERDRYLLSAGPNNSFVRNIDEKLEDFYVNITTSINNYEKSLDQTILNLEVKEKEFTNIYNNIPENEKILRSIERELEVKESLFLLLLQKREEAAINFAVVKPSIKVIDSARGSKNPVSPKKPIIYLLFSAMSLIVPSAFLYLRFLFDTKIHTKEHIISRISNIPIIGEIPFQNNTDSLNTLHDSKSREPMAESIRMISGNLNFILFDDKKDSNKNNLILVTSSVKGEGKTIISANLASVMSSKYKKILLIGADMRNPQLHKFLNLEKDRAGLSDYIYKNELDWKDCLISKSSSLDILLSGTIPPNPTELLSSNKFENLIKEVSDLYDYIIIDSAPCILVSDTFEISKYVDTTLYVVRSNFTENKLCDFINECNIEGKLKNINIVFNGVGNSQAYGYKYGYQYGYNYGYKYAYNYGYGYGYSEDTT